MMIKRFKRNAVTVKNVIDDTIGYFSYFNSFIINIKGYDTNGKELDSCQNYINTNNNPSAIYIGLSADYPNILDY